MRSVFRWLPICMFFIPVDLLGQGINTFVPANSVAFSDRDSVLLESYFFDPSRSLFQNIARTGGYGSAVFNPFAKLRGLGWSKIGFIQYDALRKPTNIIIGTDTVGTRTTLIDYHIGTKKEQHIDVSLYQHLLLGWHMGLDLGALTTPGDFSRQFNSGRNFRLWSDYKSRNGHYSSFISYSFFRELNQVNGGIRSDSVFENANALDTRTLPVYLDRATSRVKSNTYHLFQKLRLYGEQDSINDKSSLEIYLAHTFDWDRSSHLFESVNPDSGYFSAYWFDSTATYDSSFFNDINNSISVEFNKGLWYWSAGYTGQHFKYALPYQFDVVSGYTSGMNAAAGFISERASLRSKLDWALSGYAAGSFNASFDFDWRHGKNAANKFNVNAGYSVSDPTLLEQYYVSNHFAWNNDFSDFTHWKLDFNDHIDRMHLTFGAELRISKGYIFFHEDAIPQQFAKQLAFGNFSVSKDLKFRKFCTSQRLSFGYSSNENVVNVPVLKYFGAYYYHEKLFKGALDFKSGFDIELSSPYYYYGFMPATGVFFIQNNVRYGIAHLSGFFMNLGIGSATIIIRLDHWNAGIGDRNYYGAAHYPMPGRTLKFGVRWKLKD